MIPNVFGDRLLQLTSRNVLRGSISMLEKVPSMAWFLLCSRASKSVKFENSEILISRIVALINPKSLGIWRKSEGLERDHVQMS